jgi:hypothetical protein
MRSSFISGATIVRKLSFGLIFFIMLLAFGAQAQDDEIIVIEHRGYIDSSFYFKEYTVTLEAGQSILITAERLDGDLDTFIELYSPNNLRVAFNDDRNTMQGIYDSALGYTAIASGDYTIRMTRYDFEAGTSTGNYLLTIRIGDQRVLDALNDLITRVELSGPVETVGTEHFLIHYTTVGDDAVTQEYLDEVVFVVEEVWEIQIVQMGWPPPPPDNSFGGDDRYDIYIMDLIGSGEGALGITSPEQFVGDNPATPDLVEENASSSYIMIENDMTDVAGPGRGTPISLMRATVGHEFHHAIQFGYDAAEPNGWYFEATATYMEVAAMGKDEDATGYVETAYMYPEICFGTSNDPEGGSLRYGEWTFMDYMVRELGPQSLLELWANIAKFDHLEALDNTVSVYDMTTPQIVAQWRLANLARDYDLAEEFNATVWIEETISDVGRWTFTGQGIQELSANYFIFALTPGTYYAGLVNDGGSMELWAAGVANGQLDAFPLGRGASFDTTGYDNFYLMVFNPVYDNTPDDCQYRSYAIDVTPGKEGTFAPARSFNARYFEPPS